MCADDCHTYIPHFEGKEVVSRNRLGIPWIIGFVGVIWAVSSSQISKAVPLLSFCGFVDQGRVRGPSCLYLTHFRFSIKSK